MNIDKLRPLKPSLLILALFGFFAVNCSFLYFAFIDTETYMAAMKNGMALLFISEAFLLMFFFAFLIAKLGWKKPGWIFFIGMSLIGSLAFSIPLQIYLYLKTENKPKT